MAGLALTGGSAPEAATPPAPLAVRVTADGCRAVPVEGSGVAVGGARVATVAHVVAGATTIRLVTTDGRTLPAAVVALDPERDVALLDAPGLDEPPARLAPLAAGRGGVYRGFGHGRPVAVVPFTVKRAVTVVSEDIWVKGSHPRPGYILAARVVHGDSGAGLIGRDGTLAGLVWATSRNDESEGWAVSSEVLAPLLAATPTPAPPTPAVPCPPA